MSRSVRAPGVPVPRSGRLPSSSGRLAQLVRDGESFAPPPFAVSSLSLASPLHLEISWIPGAISALAGLALGRGTRSLFIRALRDPEQLGAWLPSLVDSWRRHWIEADLSARRRAILARATDDQVYEVYRATAQLHARGMTPEEISDAAGGPQSGSGHLGQRPPTRLDLSAVEQRNPAAQAPEGGEAQDLHRP